jgi:NhaA family Na+:H+ antiporter
VGIVLWVCMYKSGIHATLAGVILAFSLPAQTDVRLSALHDWLDGWATELDDNYDDEAHVLGQHDFTDDANIVERVMHHVTPPLLRTEHNISVLVNFGILPLFAFVNAQVRLVGVDPASIVGNSVTQGAFLGAVLGKPMGIILVTLLLVRVGFAKLPRHVDWIQIIAVGIMGGLGFTMSILIAGLAFPDPVYVMAAKCAILAGSVTSAMIGIVFVHIAEAVIAQREQKELLHPEPDAKERP